MVKVKKWRGTVYPGKNKGKSDGSGTLSMLLWEMG